MSFEIQRATRQGVIPLIGLYGESGTGKTMSALLMARGFVGPTGKIGMVDTESRRGSLYADVIPGGYDVLNLDDPFSPVRYIEAWETLVKWGAQILVTDSFSHEHEGKGGILDMAAANEERSGKQGLHNWRQPKMEHAKLMQWILRSPVPMICCVRAKFKTRQGKDERGKTIIIKDDHVSPIQSEDFVFELTAHACVLPDHTVLITKASHPELRKCLPEDRKEPIAIKHGEALARWCAAPGQTAKPSTPAAAGTPIDKYRDRALVRLKEAGYDEQTVTNFLLDKGWIEPGETTAKWVESRVPTSAEALEALKKEIEALKG